MNCRPSSPRHLRSNLTLLLNRVNPGISVVSYDMSATILWGGRMTLRMSMEDRLQPCIGQNVHIPLHCSLPAAGWSAFYNTVSHKIEFRWFDYQYSYPSKYPHLVIPTGGPVDRKLSLCHLDRSGEIWHTSKTDFPTSDYVLRSKWHTGTTLRYITGNTVRSGKGELPRLNYSRIWNESARKRKTCRQNFTPESFSFLHWIFLFFCHAFGEFHILCNFSAQEKIFRHWFPVRLS